MSVGASRTQPARTVIREDRCETSTSSLAATLLRASFLALALLGCICTPQAAFGQAPRYRITDLGTLGGSFARANSVNDKGQVVGESDLASVETVTVPFIWTGGVMMAMNLGNVAGSPSGLGLAINNDGKATGQFGPASNTLQRGWFVYDVNNSAATYLLRPGFGRDINNNGDVLGDKVLPNGVLTSVIIGRSGTTDLGALFGEAFSGKKINNRGFVVGGPAQPPNHLTGFLFSSGGFVPIGGAVGFYGTALNDRGQIAGFVREQTQFFGILPRAALRQADGTIQVFAPISTFSSMTVSAINNQGIIVGTDVATNPHVPFIIENGALTNLNGFLPPGSGWQLLDANDINDRGQIVGVGRINGQVHAYLLTPEECSLADDVDANGNPDNDGDGLCDAWETSGVDGDGNGTVDLDLAALGADMNHKDLFLEIDYMMDHRPDPEGLTLVKNAFAFAPVDNPDFIRGIRLHMVGGESGGTVDEELPHSLYLGFPETIDSRCPATSFNDLKQDWFGTSAQRNAMSAAAILGAKRKVFRYVIFGHQQEQSFDAGNNACVSTTSGGVAELPGNDLMVTLGGWDFTPYVAMLGCSTLDTHEICGRRQAEAGTLMHELGHTLNLRHGGSDDINCKPNDLSVMNYLFQLPITDSARPLSYSDTALPDLDKANLSEPMGIQGPAGRFVFYGQGMRGVLGSDRADSAANWNGDVDSMGFADRTDLGVSADINRIESVCPVTGPTVVGSNLNLHFTGTLDVTSFPAPDTFSVTVDGVVQVPSTVTVLPNDVELTLAAPVAPLQSVAVAYTRPALNPLLYTDGSVQSDFNVNITNRTYSLFGYNGWANLLFSFRNTPDFADGLARVTLPDEPEVDQQSALALAQSVDFDGDGLSNAVDNCDEVANPAQTDLNGNGIGDACEGAGVADTTPPTVTAPASITATATETAGARGSASPVLATFLAGGSAVDAVDASPVRLLPQVAGASADNNTLFPLGATAVMFRFRDASGNIGGSTANVTVVGPFALRASSARLNITGVGSANTAIVITPGPGFTTRVDLACSGLPAGVTCRFDPASVTPTGGDATSMLTVAVDGNRMAGAAPADFIFGPAGPEVVFWKNVLVWKEGFGWAFAMLLVILAWSLSSPLRGQQVGLLPQSHRRAHLRLPFGLLLLLILLQAACAGGPGDGSQSQTQAVSPGIYTFNVTATSASIQQSIPVVLEVR